MRRNKANLVHYVKWQNRGGQRVFGPAIVSSCDDFGAPKLTGDWLKAISLYFVVLVLQPSFRAKVETDRMIRTDHANFFQPFLLDRCLRTRYPANAAQAPNINTLSSCPTSASSLSINEWRSPSSLLV